MKLFRFNKRKPKSMKAAYRRVFDTEDGRKVLADLAEEFNMTRPTYAPGMKERDAVYFEGGRKVILYILGVLNMDINTLPKEYTNG